jgi:glycosyltransferase involved in cell wall biosynthesis
VQEKKKVLMIVQNNSVPFDKRVFKEAQSLSKNGYKVFIICPQTKIDWEKKSVFDDITIYRYKNYTPSGTIIGFILEFLVSLTKIYYLSLFITAKEKIKIVHVANPPDFFWPMAIICKLVGIKFIYDQHDLAPELFTTKFKSNFFHVLLLLSEKFSVLFSDGIIVVNNSFKKRLINKWGINAKPIEVVYNGPEEDFIPIKNTDLVEKYRSKKVILYIGLMTVNDNIEIIIEAAKKIITEQKRPEFQFVLLGDGDVRRQAEMTARKYGIEKNIEFKGIVDHKTVKEFLYVADICLAPDFPNGLNEYLTLIKILEYMKSKKPFVSFDLLETRIIGDGAGLFAKDIDDFAQKIIFLNDNPEICNELGLRGEEIINKKFLWKYSERSMLNLYSKLDQKK